MRTARPLCSTLLLLLLIGCSSSMQSGTLSGDPDVISRSDVLETGRTTALEVIQAVRPQWLRMRSAQSANREGGIRVYLDGARFGDLGTLSAVPAGNIQRIERFSTTTATQRWGPGHSDGVIEILTRLPS